MPEYAELDWKNRSLIVEVITSLKQNNKNLEKRVRFLE